MVQVILAGMNVDVETLDEMVAAIKEARQALKEGRMPDPEIINRADLASITPETISAAYARISRDPQSVTELRRIARRQVSKARESNESIAYDLGHFSIAEHAVFNFDVLGLSRLGVEFLEGHRLASYTEKSQRYVVLDKEFVMPEELKGTPFQPRIETLVGEQFELYKRALHLLIPYMEEKFKRDMGHAPQGKEKRTAEGWAKEDARYDVSLMAETQLGMTVNARELERIIRVGKHHPSAEVRELASQFFAQAEPKAPSLLILADPANFERTYKKTVDDRFIIGWPDSLGGANKKALEWYRATASKARAHQHPAHAVELISRNAGGEELIMAALLEEAERLPLKEARAMARRIVRSNQGEAYIRQALEKLGEHDTLPRAWENADLVYGVTMSASCYAQMKRHRMATLLPFAYDPALGITLPQSVKDVGLEGEYWGLLEKGSLLFAEINDVNPAVAPYVLSNAHRRLAILKMNLRELYAFSRLREDGHAQWDIRDIAHDVVSSASGAYPLFAAYACGKDTFPDVKRRADERFGHGSEAE